MSQDGHETDESNPEVVEDVPTKAVTSTSEVNTPSNIEMEVVTNRPRDKGSIASIVDPHEAEEQRLSHHEAGIDEDIAGDSQHTEEIETVVPWQARISPLFPPRPLSQKN